MNKGRIVIVECISSSVNYILDAYDEGYEPILLEPYCNFIERNYWKKYHDYELNLMLGKDIPWPKRIMANKDYCKNLKMVKDLNPVAIIPGSDRGVELATKLAADLGLRGNNPANLPKMCNKYFCQQALKEFGNIRHIRSLLVSTCEEALSFYEAIGCSKVVIKPVAGISSIGVFICNNKEDIKKAINSNKEKYSYTRLNGNTGKILIQEYIDGVEYEVNSVSCNGIHKITSIFRYTKKTIPGKGKIYDYDESIDANSDEAKQLSEYQISVLNAIGIKYGAIHSEIMLDKKGPVLIEANCRLSGGSKRREWLEEVFNVAESTLSLKSYLDDNLFSEEKNLTKDIIFCNNKKGLSKEFSLKKAVYVRKSLVRKKLEQFQSFRTCDIERETGFCPQTISLSTAFATASFSCNDESERKRIIEILKRMEDKQKGELYDGIYIPIICEIVGKIHS